MSADPATELATYTIYRLPLDIPGQPYMVRQWIIGRWIEGVGDAHHVPQPGWVKPASSLEDARRKVPARADHCMPRREDDDPSIVETWL